MIINRDLGGAKKKTFFQGAVSSAKNSLKSVSSRIEKKPSGAGNTKSASAVKSGGNATVTQSVRPSQGTGAGFSSSDQRAEQLALRQRTNAASALSSDTQRREQLATRAGTKRSSASSQSRETQALNSLTDVDQQRIEQQALRAARKSSASDQPDFETIGKALTDALQKAQERNASAQRTAARPPETVALYGAEEVYDLIGRLGDDFPSADFDGMNTSKQLEAVRNTDLSREEQWKLLNAGFSVGTLKLIHDLEKDYSRYGLGRSDFETVAGELMQIANARIGTSTGDIPFESQSSRRDFHTYLNEREDSLLSSIGYKGKKPGDYDQVLASWGNTKYGEIYRDNKKQNPSPLVSQFPAVSSMLGDVQMSGAQTMIIRSAQQDIDALFAKGKPTQQQVDDVIAAACTELLTNEIADRLGMRTRKKNPKTGKYEFTDNRQTGRIFAFTDEIDDLLNQCKQEAAVYDKIQGVALGARMIGCRTPIVGTLSFLVQIATETTQYFKFYNAVKDDARLDVKKEIPWEASIGDDTWPGSSSYKFVYRGELMDAQQLGNMVYGYTGAAVGFSKRILFIAGGLVANKHEYERCMEYNEKYVPELRYYGDSEDDHNYIEKGYHLFHEEKGQS